MAKKIFFGNYKGGVGKTTSVFSVAHYMAQDFKKKVLMIDIDPQSSLSEICLRNTGQRGTLDKIPANETLNYVFDLSIRSTQRSKIPLLFDNEKLIKKCKNDNIFYVASSLRYENHLGLDELSMKMKNVYIFKNQTDNYVAIARTIAEGAVIDKENKDGKIGYKEITKELMTRISALGR